MDDLVAGRYQLVRTLGRGGMGEVLLARQLDLDKLVVVKRADVRSERNQRALVEEARIAARLNHPNIVSVLEVLERPDQAIVVMEFVPGVTLRELIEDASDGLPPEVALAIAVDILRGLGYAHGVKRGDAIGVIHRDVKPRNLMVTFAGTTKLIDFGISRWLDDSGGWDATSVSGTRGYMAPEQLEGGRVDGRADQYAVGVTLREMLTGVPPVDDTGHRGKQRTEIADSYLAAIVERASAPLAGDRFPSCADMISAIETYGAAAGTPLAVTGVERYVSARFAARKTSLEGDAEHRRPRPPTSPTLMERAPRGVDPASLESRIRLSSRDADGSDHVLGAVCERLLRRWFLHAPVRRFDVVDRDPAQHVELSCARRDSGFEVVARIGSGEVASGTGPSVIEAIASLGNALVERATQLPELGPDDAATAAMRKLGTPSFDAYRHYQRAIAIYISNWWVQDLGALVPEAEAAIAADPGWAHAHGLLATLLGMSTPDSAAALAAARGEIDRARDAHGIRMVDALAAKDVTTKPYEAAFRANPDDLLAALHLIPYAAATQQLDDAFAVARKVHDSYPESLFGADLAQLFSRGGRDSEAETVIRDWARRCPENLGAVLELARLEATAGNVGELGRLTRMAVAIHGERDDYATMVFEIYVLADDFGSAQRIADRMLLGSELARARGRYRNALLAALDGRFSAAHASVRRAVDEHRAFGWQSELAQCLALAVTTARIVGDKAAARRYSSELGTFFESLAETAEAARVRYDAATDESGAPPVDEFLAALPEGAIRDAARVAIVRSAALSGIVPAADAVAAGFFDNEQAPSSLLALGLCAHREGEHAIARRAYERAIRLWSPMVSYEASPYHATLARYHLAKLFVELGQRDDARRHYEAFLRRWGDADRPIAEVTAARKELAAL